MLKDLVVRSIVHGLGNPESPDFELPIPLTPDLFEEICLCIKATYKQTDPNYVVAVRQAHCVLLTHLDDEFVFASSKIASAVIFRFGEGPILSPAKYLPLDKLMPRIKRYVFTDGEKVIVRKFYPKYKF